MLTRLMLGDGGRTLELNFESNLTGRPGTITLLSCSDYEPELSDSDTLRALMARLTRLNPNIVVAVERNTLVASLSHALSYQDAQQLVTEALD